MRIVRVVWLAACLTALAAGWGEPIEAVLKGVAAPEVNTRIQALQRAIDEELRDPRLSEPLRTLAADANPRVRALAITLLGRYADDTGVGDILFRALDDKDIGVQRAAIAAQERFANHRAEERLVALATAKNSPLRADALAALVRKWGHRNLHHTIQDSTRMPEMIAAALRDPDAVLRRATAKALADIVDEYDLASKVFTLLGPSVKDTDAGVRLSAVQALGHISDPGVPAVLASAIHDKDEAVVEGAWQSLEAYRDRPFYATTYAPAFPRAMATLLADPDATVRVNAVIVLQQGKADPAVAPLVRPLLADKDEDVRAYTALALGALKDAAAVEPLIAALADKDAGVRCAAAGALGNIANRRAAQPLLALARDTVVEVRQSVAFALGNIGDPAGIEALLRLRADKDTEVGDTALWALGKFPGDPRAVKVLAAALTDARPEARAYAVDALTGATAPAAIDALIAALQDRDLNVRATAAGALHGTTEPRAVEALLLAMQDDEWEVSAVAVGALSRVRNNPHVTKAMLALALDEENGSSDTAARILGYMRDPAAVRPLLLAFARLAPRTKDNEPPSFSSIRFAVNRYGEMMRQAMLTGMTDPDAAVRDAALRGLVWYPDARALPLLLPVLRDPSAERRMLAVLSLGTLRDARGVEPLIPLLDDADPAVRNEALWALSNISDLRALTALAARVDLVVEAGHGGGNTDYMDGVLGTDPLENFCRQLTLIDEPGMSALLAGLLKVEHPRIQAAVERALAQRGDAAAVEALTTHLLTQKRMRRWGTYVFDNDAPPAPAMLERMLELTRDASVDARRRALSAISALRDDPRVREAFTRVAAEDADPQLREYAKGVLEGKGQVSMPIPALPDLLRQLRDPDSAKRLSGLHRLGSYLMGPRCQWIIVSKVWDRRLVELPPLSTPVVDPAPLIDPLLPMLTDTDTAVRVRAIGTLALTGDPRALDAIAGLANDEDTEIATTALLALARRGDPRALDPAVARLGRETADYESLSARALGLLKDARAVEPLLAALKRLPHNEDILWALGMTGDPRAVEPLIAVMEEDGNYEQHVPPAAMLLGELRDPRAVEPLLRILDRLAVGNGEFGLDGARPTVDTRRDLVIAALGRIGDRRAVEPLIAVLSQGVMPERRAAAVALEQLGDPRAVEPLRAELPNLTGSARAAAQHALAVLSRKGS